MTGAAQPSERTCRASRLLVVQTCVVQSRDGLYSYEIHLAPDAEPGAHLTVLRTEDEDVYQLALKVEGKSHARVNATWHYARRGSYRFAVLDSLEMCPS
jgi:hypothetical protein